MHAHAACVPLPRAGPGVPDARRAAADLYGAALGRANRAIPWRQGPQLDTCAGAGDAILYSGFELFLLRPAGA